MATGSIPDAPTSRVLVQLFARQLTGNAVAYEEYREFDSGSVSFSDGAAVRVSISGDRSSLRMVLSAALALVRPPDPDPEPPQNEAEEEAA
jgi:hypothetical protein